ncbi:MAG: hypothetical protein KQJ78_10845 [Deltaproteobacteria bacterium]|nr:hypothetical protein [Deltaproteobacteria bacterium]
MAHAAHSHATPQDASRPGWGCARVFSYYYYFPTPVAVSLCGVSST